MVENRLVNLVCDCLKLVVFMLVMLFVVMFRLVLVVLMLDNEILKFMRLFLVCGVGWFS